MKIKIKKKTYFGTYTHDVLTNATGGTAKLRCLPACGPWHGTDKTVLICIGN
jgi:hypothetical protein